MPSIALDDIKFFAIQSKFTKERDKNFRLIITNDHPFMQTLLQKAQAFCFTMSHDADISPPMVQIQALRPFSLARSGDFTRFGLWLKKHMPEAERIKTQIHYDKNQNCIYLVYHRNKACIQWFGDIVHELEHAKQANGVGYTKNEQIMLKIHNALYITADEDHKRYQNNYSEIWARIREAQAYVRLYNIIKDDSEFTMRDKKVYLEACQQLSEYLQSRIKNSATATLNANYMQIIEDMPGHDVPVIFDNFSDVQQQKDAIIDFLFQEGPMLNLKLCTELRKTLADLSQSIDEMEKDGKMQSKSIPYPEKEEIMCECAIAHGISQTQRQDFAAHQLQCLPLSPENYKKQIDIALRNLDYPYVTRDEHHSLCIIGRPKVNKCTPLSTSTNRVELNVGITRHVQSDIDTSILDDDMSYCHDSDDDER